MSHANQTGAMGRFTARPALAAAGWGATALMALTVLAMFASMLWS